MRRSILMPRPGRPATPLHLLTLAALVVLLAVRFAAPRPVHAQGCTCEEDFDVLVERLEQNYVGYRLEVEGKREAAYAAHKARTRQQAQRAQQARGPACIDALKAFVAFFKDGHLFIAQAPDYPPEDLERFRAATQRRNLSAANARAYLGAQQGRLDPIEGIWYSRDYEVAVVRDTTGTAHDFVAVVLETDVAGWAPGQVQAVFTAADPGRYRATLKAADHSTRSLDARIYKNLLLHMPPYTWGRRALLDRPERALLHPADPRAPTYTTLSQEAAVLSIPSHAPGYRGAIDSLLRTHHEALVALETLIIDIRGDEGGSSGTTSALTPYLFTDAQRPALATEGRPAVLASPTNLRYFEGWKAWFEETPDWLSDLLRRLAAHDGAVIPFSEAEEDAAADALARPDTVYAGPQAVAVLIDRGVFSAGEAFVLTARRYRRVTLFGQNTGGMIDYQNVNMIRLACRTEGYLLGYPTMAGSDALPKGGLNKEGIPPDVYVGAHIAQPLDFILGYYAARRR